MSKRTVHHLNKHGLNRRVSRKRIMFKVHKKGCHGVWKSAGKPLENGNWDKVIFSDESQMVIETITGYFGEYVVKVTDRNWFPQRPIATS